MNIKLTAPAQIWWIARKDLVCELRGRETLPWMIMLGVTIGFLLNYQVVLPAEQQAHVAASLCWITIGVASFVSLGSSMRLECDDDCWETLRQYPVSPETIYFAKLSANSVMLAIVQLVVVPFFAITTEATWLSYPGRFGLISLLANVSVSSVGTLLAATSLGQTAGRSVLCLLVLPLLLPALLGASEATRLLGDPQAIDVWWNWTRLLATFAIVYTTLGWMLFRYLIEE